MGPAAHWSHFTRLGDSLSSLPLNMHLVGCTLGKVGDIREGGTCKAIGTFTWNIAGRITRRRNLALDSASMKLYSCSWCGEMQGAWAYTQCCTEATWLSDQSWLSSIGSDRRSSELQPAVSHVVIVHITSLWACKSPASHLSFPPLCSLSIVQVLLGGRDIWHWVATQHH